MSGTKEHPIERNRAQSIGTTISNVVRRPDGGLRVGEMEKDALLLHALLPPPDNLANRIGVTLPNVVNLFVSWSATECHACDGICRDQQRHGREARRLSHLTLL
jgi:hypothetical protein